VKISDFKSHGTHSNGALLGSVLVTTGHLWWKKAATRGVFKKKYEVFWRWQHNGEYTPGYKVENLAHAAHLRDWGAV
jgi:hypothetical protein